MMSRSAGLRRPAHRDLVILDLKCRLLGVVDHPEQDRIHVYRNGVRGQRLLGGEAGGDDPLIDPGRDLVDAGDDPEQPRPAQARVLAQPQHDRPLPLLGNPGRHPGDASQDRPHHDRPRVIPQYGDPGPQADAGQQQE